MTEETDQAHAAVSQLLNAAFETDAEAQIVTRLRADRAMAVEIVLPDDGRIAAYAALSYMTEPEGWVCLAPVAVAPELQGRGLGRRVMELVQKWLEEKQINAVVLGEPDFYGKFGFSSARAVRLQTPYPLEFTMLSGPGPDTPVASLVYPAAFSDDSGA